MKRIALATAAFVAAVVVLGLVVGIVSLPPAQRRLPPADDGTVAGALHVHTNRSDGRSAPDVVAAAAARAGLRFVVFTDHGDATRAPDPPSYRSGVLCIDAVEISTSRGHYVAIGLPQAPYRLGGEPRDVVEDVARLGGFGIAAHPDSLKDDLRWDGWGEPFDGIELMNADSSWRVHTYQSIFRSAAWFLRTAAAYPWRPAETLARALSMSRETTARWLQLARERPIVGVAGLDAHGQIGMLAAGDGDNRFALPIPGYQSAFRSMSVHVTPSTPLTGRAADDAASLIAGLRAGHAYVAVDGIATPPAFHFSVQNAKGQVAMGDTLEPDGKVAIEVESNAPSGFETTVWKDGRQIDPPHHEDHFIVHSGETDGVFHVEVRATSSVETAPWILSNPIYVRAPRSAVVAPVDPLSTSTSGGAGPRAVVSWRAETDPASHAAMSGPVSAATMQFALVTQGQPYAAAVGSVNGALAGCDRITFTTQANRPMRVSVQVRTGESGVPDERWQRAVYADDRTRRSTMDFPTFTPIASPHGRSVPLDSMHEVLWVLDETHMAPGTSGSLTISDVRLRCDGVRRTAP